MPDLTKIIDIRERKIADAKKAEKQAVIQLNNAEASVLRAKQDMQDYSEEIKNKEKELLSGLMNKEITVNDIAKLETEMKKIEQHAIELSKAYNHTKKITDLIRKEVEKAQQIKQESETKLKKIQEVSKAFDAEKIAEATALEEAQIDEFVETMWGRK